MRARLAAVLGLSAGLAFAQTLTITTTSLPDGTANSSYLASLFATGGTPPYTWSVSGLPSGLSVLADAGQIFGNPTSGGVHSVTVTVTDSLSATATASLTLAIMPPLVITTPSLPNGTVGLPYSAALSASGGGTPYAWSSTAALPPGLAIDPQTGAISGVPTTAGPYTVAVQVSDANHATTPHTYSITIAPPVAIATASLPNGTVGAPYSTTVAATGGTPPYAWSASSLPPGLNINAQTGQISGTPTTAGTYNATVQVTDTNSGTASHGYTVTIVPPLVVTTTSLPNGTAGAAYSASLAASGGTPPYTWSASSLPPGVEINTQTGQLSGTPSAAGTYNVAVQVKDAGNVTASKSFSVPIAPALAITTASLPGGKTGSAYSATLVASGGTPPYTWSATSLPAGLNVNAQTGQISGTPTAAGTTNVTFKVTDSAGISATAVLAMAIDNPPPPLTLTGSFAGGTVGAAYSQTLTAGGGTPPYKWSIASGSLPPGLALNEASGAVAGRPTQTGAFDFTIRVTDSAGASTSAAARIVIAAALSITTTSLPNGAIGSNYSQGLAASGGAPPYTWSVTSGSLPGGLTLDGRAGSISGMPSAAGRFTLTIQVQDSGGATAARQFSLTIVSNLMFTSTSPLPAAAVGSPYSQALAAISGLPPYTWMVSGGTLPQGITLDPTTGVLSGSAQTAGAYSFTITVTDATSASSSRTFALTVVGALAVSTTSLAGASLRTPYSQTLAAVAGTSPYTWSVTEGSLPPGLALNSTTGAISGTPTTQGNYAFTVQVKDAVGATATAQLSITVGPALSVTSGPALPPGALATAYAATLAAAGGTAPYTWAIASGSLPAGLALNASTGAITGTPTAAGNYNFSVTVTDATRATATANLSLTVAAQGVPMVAITDAPDTAGPLEQPAVGLSLASPYPAALGGELTLSFEPDAAVPVDDPAIQFSTGGRTVSFTIPAGATQASFPVPALQFQTGSVSGTITIAVKLMAGGSDITPSPAPVQTIKIARAAPVIRSLKLVKTASGFEAWITGYATTRELTQASVRFTPVSGSNLQTTSVTVPMTDAAKQWFEDAGSAAYGSQFTIIQPFTGGVNVVASVSVTLTSAAGSSAASSASF